MGKREDNRVVRRQEALLAARVIIAEGGVEALTMRRLATVSSLAVNTLYALFETREGVLAAVVADGIVRVSGQLAAQGEGPPLVAADELVRLSVARIRDEAAFTRPMYRALSAFGPVGDVGRQHASTVLEGILLRAVAEGQLRDDVDLQQLVQHILAGFMAASMRWAHDQIDLDELEAQARYALWVGLGAASTSKARPVMAAGLHKAERALLAAQRARGRQAKAGRAEPKEG